MASEDSMDHEFIKKLTEILEVNLENDQFGVTELTEEVGLSRSQLYRKIHFLTGKSASQFIREYRLQRAMEMLQNNEATASEIAYRVGFGSPTYFSTCFHDYYGYPPGEAKFRKPSASEKTENIRTSEQVYTEHKVNKTTKRKKKTSGQRMILITSLGIVLIFALFYFFYTRSIDDKTIEIAETVINDKSIAVLPFKNLSDDKTNQYFADGVMTDILNHLSSIKELKVISATTMEQYRESDKTAPEIAAELRISFMLEASVQKYEDTVRINVKLVDARNDQQIWFKDFKREYKDIFTLQSTIAKEIAIKLETTLSHGELEQIEKIPTKDLEAYTLYLTGRFLWNKGAEVDINNGIKYFERSIEKDPSYALAYAGLADVYLFLTGNGSIPRREGSKKVKELTLKSIKLDSTIAEAHATLGFLTVWLEWNWTEAEKELELSLKLNPNLSKAHLYYADYLYHIKGRYDEAREHMNQALFLDPLSYNTLVWSANHYFFEGRYDKAHMALRKAKEINKYATGAYWSNFTGYLKQKKYREAKDELQQIMRLDTTTIKNVEIVEAVYEQSGIDGIFHWLIDLDNTVVQNFALQFFTAQKYAFLGEKEKALALLEKSFEMRSPSMIGIKENFYFESLHDEPRYIALLKKMGMEH